MEEEKEGEIKETVIDSEVVDRQELDLQTFMKDMDKIGLQVNNPKLKKSDFFYGDLSVTNYLLWKLLGEMIMLNDKLKEED